MKKPGISISWSGGKDSALALYYLRQSDDFDIVELHTVFNVENKRVGLHGIHENLIQKQADLLCIPLSRLYLETDSTTKAYEKLMHDHYKHLARQGIQHVMFGDIFLEDLKDFRDAMLRKSGLKGIYPLWQKNTHRLLKEFLDAGFESVLCAGDADKLPKELIGKPISSDLLTLDVDPCGENGEYHSFVTQSPMFEGIIPVEIQGIKSKEYQYDLLDKSGGLITTTKRFWFADIAY